MEDESTLKKVEIYSFIQLAEATLHLDYIMETESSAKSVQSKKYITSYITETYYSIFS